MFKTKARVLNMRSVVPPAERNVSVAQTPRSKYTTAVCFTVTNNRQMRARERKRESFFLSVKLGAGSDLADTD